VGAVGESPGTAALSLLANNVEEQEGNQRPDEHRGKPAHSFNVAHMVKTDHFPPGGKGYTLKKKNYFFWPCNSDLDYLFKFY